MEAIMNTQIRPLRSLGLAISRAARGNRVQSSGVRGCVDSFGMSLSAVSKGYQFDTRTMWQRLTDKGARYHLARAFGLSHFSAIKLSGR